MVEDENSDGRLIRNRRSFLKKAATTSALGFTAVAGSSGSAVATRKGPSVKQKPLQREAILIFRRFGSDLLTLLAEEGLLERGAVLELPLDKPADYGAVASKSTEGVNFAAWDSEHADEYRAVKHLAEGILSVAIQPAEDHAYAFYEPYDTDKTYIAKAGHGMENVETSSHSCNDECYCVDQCGNSVWADRYCCVLYPCETDTSCSWNTYCDCCNGCS
ncbi:hypothetical protein [Haladaptatus cibarius]|uniref:hypothetical protein n=1 Tax=Haladaptatus cibarius TaxID=453847 RepID=UPI001184D445|nr:hypothetical protein [Haladaptatus cibarius]